MKRPIGVTIIAIIAIIAGVLQLLAGLSLLGAGAGAATGFIPQGLVPAGLGGTDALAAIGIGGGLAALIMGALELAFGVGALMLRSWAWTLGVVLYAISVIAGVVGLVLEFNVAVLISTLVAAAILAYLMMPSVRAAFGHGPVMAGRGHTGGRPVTHA